MPSLADLMKQGALSAQPSQGSLSDLMRPALMNPNLARQGETLRESQFMRGILSTPWYSEFVKQYGEAPDLSRNADYDYRSAWASGIRPTPDPYDNNRYHWPSSLPSGQMLKSENHPTAWKEHYMRETGTNPDAVGMTQERWALIQALKNRGNP